MFNALIREQPPPSSSLTTEFPDASQFELKRKAIFFTFINLLNNRKHRQKKTVNDSLKRK